MKVKKTLGAGVLSLGLVVGLAGFAGATSGTIGTTGPDSQNEISNESLTEIDVENDNNLELVNENDQYASSGDAETEDNTTGGDATSGDAANGNSVDAMVEVDNSQAAGMLAEVSTGSETNTGSITNTGPDSENEIEFESKVEVDVNNDNNIHIYNNNEQSAVSGDAEVEHNTTGGSATSGSVVNTSSSTFTIRVTN